MRHVFLFSLLFLGGGAGALGAESLPFKAGDGASYTLSRKIVSDYNILGFEIEVQSEDTIELDVRILSVGDEIAGYPYEVETILRRVSFSGTANGEEEISQSIVYDSANEESFRGALFEERFKNLIGVPLRFKVTGEFQVEEMTGHLAALNPQEEDEDTDLEAEDEDTDLDFNIEDLYIYPGATPWAYTFFLTQLFHLAGQDLVQSQECPVNCYPLLSWEDDPIDLNEEGVEMEQSGGYTIDLVTPDKMTATWSGQASRSEPFFWGITVAKGDVSVEVEVEWNPACPLLQQRVSKIWMKERLQGLAPSLGCDFLIEETWQASPLELQL